MPVPSQPNQVGQDQTTTSATDPTGFSFSRSGSDPALTVNAGSVAQVAFTQQPGNIIAGNVFTPAVAVEPVNQYGVAEASTAVTLSLQNAAGAALSGTVSRSTDANTGVATFPGLSVARAGSGYQLVATAGGVSRSSTAFSVAPGAVSNLAYAQQPVETKVGTVITPPVKVAATDSFGNPVPGAPVTLALDQNAAGGHLSGTLTQATDGTGTATFNNLSVDAAGFGYTLLASSGTVSRESDAFTISTTATDCTSYPCTASATDAGGDTTTTVTLTGLNQPSDLFVTLYAPSTFAPPANACGASGFQGDGTRIDVAGGGGTPTKTITWRLDRSIVNQNPNNGAAQYSICMGAVNTANPGQSWVTKSGGFATLEADGKYWGLLPFCANVVGSQPCVTSQSKNGQGDVVIAISVPSPWDEQFVGGLLKSGGI